MIVKLDYIENRNRCSIDISDNDVRERLMNAFSAPNGAKKFVSGGARRFIADRIYYITPTGTFDFGLSEIILKWLQTYVFDRTIEYHFSDSFKKKFTVDDNNYEIKDDLNFKLRDYQNECVKLALKHHFGTFVLGTGAGKTLTIAAIIHNLFELKGIKKALIVVPDNGLVTQFYDELTNQYGLKNKICKFYDKFNTLDEEAEIVIANRPLLLARFEQYKKHWIDDFDCLVVDEAHSIKRNNKVSKCIGKINSIYRFGFTGTLAENQEDAIKNFGLLGPVRYEKTSKELRDEGFLSDVKVNQLNLVYPQTPEKLSYQEEVEELNVNPQRNRFLMRLCSSLSKNVLIMVNRLEQGFTLEELFKKEITNKKIFFIRGEVDVSARDEVKKLMEENNDIICIAITKIFSTGINIKNLHNIVLASGGKSSVTVVQSIGRGLRLHPEKKNLTIYDISDKGYKYSTAHALKRKKIYKTEKIVFESTDIILQK